MSVAANRYAKALLDVLYPASAELGLEQLVKFSSLLSSQAADAPVVREPYDCRRPSKRGLQGNSGFSVL